MAKKQNKKQNYTTTAYNLTAYTYRSIQNYYT